MEWVGDSAQLLHDILVLCVMAGALPFVVLQLLICGVAFVAFSPSSPSPPKAPFFLYNSHCGSGWVAVRGSQGPAARAKQKSQTSLWCDFLLSLQMECFCQSEGHCDCLLANGVSPR